MAAMAGNEKSPCGLRDIRQATGGLWESRERRRVRVAFMAKWVRLHPSEPLLWGNALHSFDFQLFRFLSCYFLFITQKHHTFVWRFCCASFSSTHFGGAEENRTPVRKSLALAFYEYSRCFDIPSIGRPKAGFLR